MNSIRYEVRWGTFYPEGPFSNSMMSNPKKNMNQGSIANGNFWNTFQLGRPYVGIALMAGAVFFLLQFLLVKHSRAIPINPVRAYTVQAPVSLPPHQNQDVLSAVETLTPRTRVHVVVTGEPEINQVLTFTLYPYDDQFTYHIDYGDGYQQVARSRNRHLYGRPGDYHLSITVLYERDTVDYNQFSIHIRPSVSVTSPRVVYDDQGMTGGGMVMPRNEEIPEPVESTEEVEIVDLGEWDESTTNKEDVYFAVSEMPSFPGGEMELQRFLAKFVTYPEEARRRDVEGQVVVKFIVEPDGRLTNFEIIKALGYGCEEEVLHTLARMPRWEPGEHLGELVRVYYTLPITFKLM